MTTHNTASQNDFRALPATDPQSDPVMLRELQEELLSWAVQLYGARDESWRIDPPQFTNDGPQLDFAATAWRIRQTSSECSAELGICSVSAGARVSSPARPWLSGRSHVS